MDINIWAARERERATTLWKKVHVFPEKESRERVSEAYAPASKFTPFLAGAVQQDTHPQPITCHLLNLHVILSLTSSIPYKPSPPHSSASHSSSCNCYAFRFSDMAVHRSLLNKPTWCSVAFWWWMLVMVMRIQGTNGKEQDSVIKLPTQEVDAESDEVGTRWAVLVAGSNGYGNYRHQVSWFGL